MNISPSASEETITVGEAAVRLGVTLPRLLRCLKRPPFAAYTQQQNRKTRTGIRTVTVINISILPTIKSALREKKSNNKQKQSREESLVSNDGRTRVLEQVIDELHLRILDQAMALNEVRAERDRLLEERKQLQERISTLMLEIEKNQEKPETKPVPWLPPWKREPGRDRGE